MKTTLLAAAAVLSIGTASTGFARHVEQRPSAVPMPPEKPLMLADSTIITTGGPRVVAVRLSDEDRVYAKKYITDRKYQNLEDDHHYVIGDEAPAAGTYYRIEGRPAFDAYRYAELNGHIVLIDADTHRIVEILN